MVGKNYNLRLSVVINVSLLIFIFLGLYDVLISKCLGMELKFEERHYSVRIAVKIRVIKYMVSETNYHWVNCQGNYQASNFKCPAIIHEKKLQH